MVLSSTRRATGVYIFDALLIYVLDVVNASNDPFVTQIGVGKVIRGWDEGVFVILSSFTWHISHHGST